MTDDFFDMSYDDIYADKTGQAGLIVLWYQACQQGNFAEADKIFERFQQLLKG